MRNTLFAYGTLMDREIFRMVTGTSLSSHQAALNGYQRYHVVNEVYPGLVELNGCRVEGCIYSGVSPQMWDRLDFFEGEMYVRRKISVGIETGIVDADTYIVKKEYRYLLTSDVWYPESFKENRNLFLEEFRGLSTD